MSSPLTPVPEKRTLQRVLASPFLAVAVAFALRIFLLWLSHRAENPAHPRFQTVGLEANLVALSLAAGEGFFHPYPRYAALTACIAPVYPFLCAIGDKLLHLGFSEAIIWAQVMNSVFSVLTCWPIFAIGKRVFTPKIGLASAWLWVFLPYAVLFPLEWTWDQSLSALVLSLLVYVTLRMSESASSQALTGYGLLWAFAALVNPTICILLPFLLGWWIIRRKDSGRLSLMSAAKVTSIFVLALLPWTIRNYYALDGLVFVKSDFGMEFWLGNNPAVKENYTPELHPLNNQMELIALILNGEPNYSREKRHEAMAFIETHPRLFLRNLAQRFYDTWSASYDSRMEPWLVELHLGRANVWFCLAFSLLSLVGMILALRANPGSSLLLAMCLLVFPIPYYITHTALRYRHPIDPIMSIFSMYALASFSWPFRRSRNRDLAPKTS